PERPRAPRARCRPRRPGVLARAAAARGCSRVTRAIFWDNDGVLVDTEHLYYRATREVLATVGIDLTPEQYRELFLVQSRGAWHLAAERGLSPDRIQQLRDERHARFSRLVVEHPVAVAGAAEVL